MAVLAAIAFSGVTHAGTTSYAIRNGTMAGGGHTVESGQYRLIGTIAEPLQGAVSSGPFRLTAGYPATIGDSTLPPPPEPAIFEDGFED